MMVEIRRSQRTGLRLTDAIDDVDGFFVGYSELTVLPGLVPSNAVAHTLALWVDKIGLCGNCNEGYGCTCVLIAVESVTGENSYQKLCPVLLGDVLRKCGITLPRDQGNPK